MLENIYPCNQDDVEMEPGPPRGVQALFVDTSSPRRSPMPGTSANASGYPSYAVPQGSRGGGNGPLQDPFTAYFPAPLMTSTASL